jgi:hypothetical protein
MDWSKDKIDFFVDNNLVYTSIQRIKQAIWPYNQPFLLSIWQLVEVLEDRMIVDSIFPQDFSVGYIQVY